MKKGNKGGKHKSGNFSKKKGDFQKKESQPQTPSYDPKRIKGNSNQDEIRLNKFIANAGVCSRRDADKLIAEGRIKINTTVVKELGYKVKRDDRVFYDGKKLNPEKMVYVLLNKPKDHITTLDDPQERKTVMALVANACTERIYPVGRLDRPTTGLLVLTNDGELSQKLSHPSNGAKKLYEVGLDKPITDAHFEAISDGKVKLEDGLVPVEKLEIVSSDDRTLGIEIHIGRNRIVRRLFEHFGYTVEKLDRVLYAGLTKRDLPRGKWRYLSQEEVVRLKNFKL